MSKVYPQAANTVTAVPKGLEDLRNVHQRKGYMKLVKQPMIIEAVWAKYDQPP